jgi:hypothetical protein
MKENSKIKSKIKSTKIETSFTANELTNYSGIHPLKKFAEKLGIEKSLNEEIDIKLHHNFQYSTGKILMGITLGLLCGQDRISKIEKFTYDPLVQKLLNIKDKIDEDTIINRIKRFSMCQTKQFMDIISNQSNRVHQKLGTKKDIIDFDSTVQTVYGNQEGAEKGYNPQDKNKKSYHSLLAFLNSTKECIGSWLRPGNSYTANNSVEFIKEILGRMTEEIEELILRADSGFFDESLIEELESRKGKVQYIIKVKLKNLRQILMKQEWESIPEIEDIQMSEFYYRCNSWKSPRRFVAVRKKIREIREGVLFANTEYEYFCYVTDIEESPIYLHKFYGDRGESENWIEALKNQLFAGLMLTNKFWANETLLLCSVLGYNLSVWMRKLTDTQSWREEPATFRSWFIQLAGKIVTSGRKIYLKIYKAFYYKQRWKQIDDAIDELVFI